MECPIWLLQSNASNGCIADDVNTIKAGATIHICLKGLWMWIRLIFCLVKTFVVACADGFADYFITQLSMGHYWTIGPVFGHFPDAIEAIDITFR